MDIYLSIYICYFASPKGDSNELFSVVSVPRSREPKSSFKTIAWDLVPRRGFSSEAAQKMAKKRGRGIVDVSKNFYDPGWLPRRGPQGGGKWPMWQHL